MTRRRRIPPAFRVLLYLLPKHLRAEHADELDQFLALELPGSSRGRIGYWFSTLVDVLRASPGAHLDILRQDLTLALRQLRRAPGYAALAIATLAVGIGGNAGLFTVAYETLVAQPPFIEADRLVRIDENHVERGLLRFGVSPANFRDFDEAGGDLLEAAAIWQGQSGTALLGDTPERITFANVSGEFFRVFLETPVIGRALLPEDDVPGSGAVVVSHRFWIESLGGDESALGRTLEINGARHHIVGVMPEGFEYPTTGLALWKPIGLPPSEWARRGARFVGATARLAPGVTPIELEARVAARAAALAEELPETNGGWTAGVLTLRDSTSSGVRTPLLLVWAGAGLILLIAMANVANLLLARAIARQDEMSLRRALGARASRLFRQTLTEGALLSVAGAAAGTVVAALMLARFRTLGGGLVPRQAELGLELGTLAFALALALVTTLAFSVIPAVAGRDDGTRDANRRVGRSVDRARIQSGLVVGEVALAVMVAISTGLLARSAMRLLDQPLGYVPEGVTTFRVEPPMRVEPGQPLPETIRQLRADRARMNASYANLMDRLNAEPGIVGAGAVNRLPLTGDYWITGARLPASADPEEAHAVYTRVVTPGFLPTLGTELVEGRTLSESDAAGAEVAVLIDQAFVSRHWPGGSPVGGIILLDGPPNEPPIQARVVGVVETIRQARLDTEPRPTFYVSFAQALEGHGYNWGMDLVVRTSGAPIPATTLREISREFLPDAAVFRVSTMEDLVSASIADRRFQLILFGAFAVVALALTLVGVFGVLALFVRERKREFGVRQALGATPRQIHWIVQRNALRVAGAGAAIGLAGAFLAAGAFESLIYGISMYDPVAFTVGPLVLCVAALAGGLAPAVRATRTDPATVLRSD